MRGFDYGDLTGEFWYCGTVLAHERLSHREIRDLPATGVRLDGEK